MSTNSTVLYQSGIAVKKIPSQNKCKPKIAQPTINKIKTSILTVLTLGLIAFSITNVSANELTPASISYGDKSNKINDDIRHLVIKQNSESSIYDQFIGKAKIQKQNPEPNISQNSNQENKAKTRHDIIAEKQATALQQKSNAVSEIVATVSTASINPHYYTPEFSVYDASTFLENNVKNDNDADGYYQTFAVTFDVDVYNPNGNENSVIYAELYLSADGINWEHYYTTDDFLIQGNSENDAFEVITTLAEGYPSNHYDILIDIYEVGFYDIVATYSADDDNNLYALPLESAEYDAVYIEEVIIHAGSSSIVFLCFMVFMILIKNFVKCLLKIRKVYG